MPYKCRQRQLAVAQRLARPLECAIHQRGSAVEESPAARPSLGAGTLGYQPEAVLPDAGLRVLLDVLAARAEADFRVLAVRARVVRFGAFFCAVAAVVAAVAAVESDAVAATVAGSASGRLRTLLSTSARVAVIAAATTAKGASQVLRSGSDPMPRERFTSLTRSSIMCLSPAFGPKLELTPLWDARSCNPNLLTCSCRRSAEATPVQ